MRADGANTIRGIDLAAQGPGPTGTGPCVSRDRGSGTVDVGHADPGLFGPVACSNGALLGGAGGVAGRWYGYVSGEVAGQVGLVVEAGLGRYECWGGALQE